ncbi:hypothetical protein LINPERHAP2_LOCUS23751 [Linum perenne]
MKFIANPKFADRPGMQVLIFLLSLTGYVLTFLGILNDSGRAFRKMKTNHALALKFTTCYYLKFGTHMISLFSYALNLWYNTPVVFTYDICAIVAFGLGIVVEVALSYRVYRYLENSEKRRAVLWTFVVTSIVIIGVVLNSLSYHDLDRLTYIGVTISIASSIILALSLGDLRVMWESRAIPELSWLAYIFGFFGSILTLFYGILMTNKFIVIRNAIALVMNGLILVVMVWYHTTRGQLSLTAFFSSPFVRLRDALHHLAQVDVRGRLRDRILVVRGFLQQSPSTPSAVPPQESPAQELPTQEIELAPVPTQEIELAPVPTQEIELAPV